MLGRQFIAQIKKEVNVKKIVKSLCVVNDFPVSSRNTAIA